MARAKRTQSIERRPVRSFGSSWWHDHIIVRAVLLALFVMIVLDLVAQLLIGNTPYLTALLYAFIGTIVLIALIGWVLGESFPYGRRYWLYGHQSSDPFEIVKIRLAHGEISKAEYDSIIKELER
jgi:uncharacterized membrane protein